MRIKNHFGFTLIELLTVITILGILMMIAIPAVSRVIDNSRRDAFADLAQSYINAVRRSVLGNELKCCKRISGESYDSCDGEWLDIAAALSGTDYAYFNISTSCDVLNHPASCNSVWMSQTEDLMESGGKSPWGDADVAGAVRIQNKSVTRNGAIETQTQYVIALRDKARHGLRKTTSNFYVEDQKITRKNVTVLTDRERYNIGPVKFKPGQFVCELR